MQPLVAASAIALFLGWFESEEAKIKDALAAELRQEPYCVYLGLALLGKQGSFYKNNDRYRSEAEALKQEKLATTGEAAREYMNFELLEPLRSAVDNSGKVCLGKKQLIDMDEATKPAANGAGVIVTHTKYRYRIVGAPEWASRLGSALPDTARALSLGLKDEMVLRQTNKGWRR